MKRLDSTALFTIFAASCLLLDAAPARAMTATEAAVETIIESVHDSMDDGSGAGNGQLLVQICPPAPATNCEYVTYEAAILKYSREYLGLNNLPDGDGAQPGNPFAQPYAREFRKWLSYLDQAAPSIGAHLTEAAKQARFVYVNLPLAMMPVRDYPPTVVEFNKYKKAAVYMPAEEAIYISIPTMNEIAGYFEVSDGQGLTKADQQGFTMVHEAINWAFGAHSRKAETKTIAERLNLGRTLLISKLEGWNTERILTDLGARGFDYWRQLAKLDPAAYVRLVQRLIADRQAERLGLTPQAAAAELEVYGLIARKQRLAQIVGNISEFMALARKVGALSPESTFWIGDKPLAQVWFGEEQVSELIATGKVTRAQITKAYYTSGLVPTSRYSYTAPTATPLSEVVAALLAKAKMFFEPSSLCEITVMAGNLGDYEPYDPTEVCADPDRFRKRSYSDTSRLNELERFQTAVIAYANAVTVDQIRAAFAIHGDVAGLPDARSEFAPLAYREEYAQAADMIREKLNQLAMALASRRHWVVQENVRSEDLAYRYAIDVVVAAPMKDMPDVQVGQIYRIERIEGYGDGKRRVSDRVAISLVAGPGSDGSSKKKNPIYVDAKRALSGYAGITWINFRKEVLPLQP